MDDQKLLEKLIDDCTPITEISKIIGMSTTAVTKRLKDAGLKPYTKYPLWYVKEHWVKFLNGQENGKYLIKHFSNKLSDLEPASPADMVTTLQDYKGATILEPFTWTGTTALAAAKIECKYIGLVHSPGIYTDIQKMVEFLGINVNIQYGDETKIKPDLIVISIPKLSTKIGDVLTTKKWCKNYFKEFKQEKIVVGPEKVKKLFDS